MQIITSSTTGAVLGVSSWTTGFVPHKRTTRKMSERDVLSMALWLENHGRRDEADDLIEQYCAGFVLYWH